MSRFDFFRLTLFRVLALIIMIALLAGSYFTYDAALREEIELSLAVPEPTPEVTPEPIPDEFTVIPPDVAPPASNSDLNINEARTSSSICCAVRSEYGLVKDISL